MEKELTEEERAVLMAQIERLRQEHRDLDAAIEALSEAGGAADRLQLQRLKKRKLMLRDRLVMLEDQLTPRHHRLNGGAMPYRVNADLPPQVRDHLPEHAQAIFREAFNHAYAAHAERPPPGRSRLPHRMGGGQAGLREGRRSSGWRKGKLTDER